MSQESVEILLGKIVTDDEVRAHFFRAPEETCQNLGLPLTEVEMSAVRRISSHAVRQLTMSLDPRIVRAVLGNRLGSHSRDMEPRMISSKASEDMAGRMVEIASDLTPLPPSP